MNENISNLTTINSHFYSKLVLLVLFLPYLMWHMFSLIPLFSFLRFELVLMVEICTGKPPNSRQAR